MIWEAGSREVSCWLTGRASAPVAGIFVSRMKTLHVVTTPARRGAEVFAWHLATALRTADQRTEIVALTTAQSDEVLPIDVLGSSRRSLDTLASLRRCARGFDVVVAHGSSTLEASAVALAGTGTPFVYRTIGDPGYWVAPGWRSRALGVLHRRASRHVALWQGAADQLVERYGLAPERIDVIPNAVDEDLWRPADDDERRRARRSFGIGDDPCVAFVGALSPEKNVGAVLGAAERMADLQLVVAGDGPEAAMLRTVARERAPGRVIFLGSLSDPRPVYAAADLLVLPSRSEGMPAVVIEAGLVGTATVASNVGALSEMIDPGTTGYLLEVADERGLAAVVQEALPAARRTGRAASEDFRSRYTMDRVLPLWQASLARTRASAGDGLE